MSSAAMEARRPSQRVAFRSVTAASIPLLLRKLQTDRAVIDQAKGMLILLYGVDDESAFDMLRRRSQSTNVKLRAPAGQLVSDYRALSNGEALPPRWVYEKTLMIIHERIARDRSDSLVASLVHRELIAHLNPSLAGPQAFWNLVAG